MTHLDKQGVAAPIANTTTPAIDSELLIRLKRSSPASFKKLVDRYRKQGFGDGEIAQAVADAPGVISPAKRLGAPKTAGAAAPLIDAALAEHATEIRRLGRQVVEDVIEIGSRLTECKALAGHGNWLPWLKREFGWKETTALRLMRVHELAQSKSGNLPDLPVSCLYLLAAPSTPEAAKTEVIARAEAGEVLPVAEVKNVIKAHKEPKKRDQEKERAAREERKRERRGDLPSYEEMMAAADAEDDAETSAEARKAAYAADENDLAAAETTKPAATEVVADDEKLALLSEFARFVIERATAIKFEPKDHAEYKALRSRVEQVVGGGKS
jgi:hypothetical protein